MKKNHHKQGPHVDEAVNSDGSIDKAKLAAGAKAWLAAIENGSAEIVSATELAVDSVTDVIVFTRRIVKS